jgi:hypothetical protein
MAYHLFSEKLSVARKPHRCIWCCLPTLVGSTYIREHSVYDGGWQNFAWHEQCRADAMAYFRETREEEFVSGNDMPYHALYQLERQANEIPG